VGSARVNFALSVIDCAYNRQSWHGTNLRGSLRGLSVTDVARRPKRGRHNIWELVVHCAYWKYVVRRRLTGEKRGSFPLAGSNFFSVEPTTVFQTAAFVKFDRRIARFYDKTPQTLGTLANRH